MRFQLTKEHEGYWAIFRGTHDTQSSIPKQIVDVGEGENIITQYFHQPKDPSKPGHWIRKPHRRNTVIFLYKTRELAERHRKEEFDMRIAFAQKVQEYARELRRQYAKERESVYRRLVALDPLPPGVEVGLPTAEDEDAPQLSLKP